LILSELKNDNNFFPPIMEVGDKIATEINSYHDQKADCYAPYMFWNGWWRSETNTLKKKIIKLIWEDNLNFPLNDILGIEYWTRTFSAGQYLDNHVDEDTFLYAEKKIFSGPILGSIYYGCENENGGFLEIHKNKLKDNTLNALESENIKQHVSSLEEKERLAYKGNRLIIFDSGHQLHCTTPATFLE